MASSNGATSRLGSHIILGGLLLQIVIFGFFIAVSALFHHRLSAKPSSQSKLVLLPWKEHMRTIYISSGLIMVRSIVRVAGFIEGFQGQIMRHEAYLYIFDALPMVAVMAVYNIWYPSMFSRKVEKARMEGEQSDLDVDLATNLRGVGDDRGSRGF